MYQILSQIRFISHFLQKKADTGKLSIPFATYKICINTVCVLSWQHYPLMLFRFETNSVSLHPYLIKESCP